jgi:hypothetical protein
MTLLFMDGFDHYATADQPAKWNGDTGYRHSIVAAGRYGGNCMRVTDNGGFTSISIPAKTTLIAGFAHRFSNSGVASTICIFNESGSEQCSVRTDASNHLTVQRGGTVLATSSIGLTANAWYYIEFKATIGNSGSYEVRVNKAVVISGTGDTQNTGNAYATEVRLQANRNPSNTDYDDFYLCDDQGSVNNDYLGDVRVDAYYADGNGATSNLVGSDADSTNNYQLIDEATPATADYVGSATPGDKDTYTFGDISGSGTIYGVQILPYAAKSDAGSRSIKTIARSSGGTEEDGPEQSLGDTPSYLPDVRETKPGGGSWAPSDFNGAQFGVKVYA